MDPLRRAMRLSRFLDPDLVLTDLTEEGVPDVLHHLAGHVAGAVDDLSIDDVESRLREREDAHTTSLGHGVAIPHATVPGLSEQVIMVARAPRPVRFGPPDADPIRIFFVLLSPPEQEREHIKILARICRVVRHPGFLEELEEAGSAEAILEIIERVDEAHV